MGFPGGSGVKNLPASAGGVETRVRSRGGEDPLEKEMETRLSILAWRIHGQRSLAGYCLWSHTELDTTEREHTHTHTHTHEEGADPNNTPPHSTDQGASSPVPTVRVCRLQGFENGVSRHPRTATVFPPSCRQVESFFFLSDCCA